MTPVNGNFDEMLRSALRAEVDRLEPADGGLELIRRRTHAPWLVRQVSLMLTECADLVRLIAIRLEPGVTGMRAAVAARGGVWAAFVAVLSSIAAMVVPSRRRGAMHRGAAAGSGGPSPERPGSNLAWLRPVLAVVGAVVIVVAGVFGLVQVRDNLVLGLFASNTPASSGAGPASTSAPVPTLQEHSATGAIVPPSTQHGSPTPSPKATCPSTPNQQATPTQTPTDTTTPSATPSNTPTQTPTDTTTPSATPSNTPTPSPTDSTVPSPAATGRPPRCR